MSGFKRKKCEICQIKTCRMDGQKRIFMARFPLEEDRCREWVAATGNKNLINVPIEKLNQLKYVCGKHFVTKDFKKKKTQLKKNAVPRIDIAKNPLPDDLFHSFPLHIQHMAQSNTRKNVLHDHNYYSCTDRESSTSKLSIECDSKRKRSHSPSKHFLQYIHTISLKKRLIYNPSTDKIDGYEDLGDEGGRTAKIADHALVLMLQGIRKKIKQPIAYYFVKGTIAADKLTVIIKSVIRAVTKAGFTVLGTVCDQGPTNVGALNLLKTFSGLPVDSNFFLLDSEKVFILFDVPHLFKSIRNNFYQGGEIVIDNKKGKWEHLVKVEEKNQRTLHFSKITKLHIQPKFRSKMKVKLAAQILSNTTAAILKLMAESLGNKEEAREYLQTAHIVEELDKLFDCTNGPASRNDVKKGIRQNVSKKSFHHERWLEYKRKLKTLTFLKSDSQLRLRNVRCVNGFIITITSLQDIWKVVQSKNIKYLYLRQCNQDALENLFGLIRQHCPTNKNPTCHHFTSALKSAVLSRLSAPISRGANCQQDENEILFDFQDIVFQQQSKEKNPNLKNIEIPVLDADNIPILQIPDEQYTGCPKNNG